MATEKTGKKDKPVKSARPEKAPKAAKAAAPQAGRKILVIVESPTKEKTIGRFLSGDYVVRSSYGHVRDLPKDELGVDVEHGFAPKYVLVERALWRVGKGPLRGGPAKHSLRVAAHLRPAQEAGTASGHDQFRRGQGLAHGPGRRCATYHTRAHLRTELPCRAAGDHSSVMGSDSSDAVSCRAVSRQLKLISCRPVASREGFLYERIKWIQGGK